MHLHSRCSCAHGPIILEVGDEREWMPREEISKRALPRPRRNPDAARAEDHRCDRKRSAEDISTESGIVIAYRTWVTREMSHD